MKRCVPLEPQAEAVCQASSKPPLIFELPVAQGRMVLEEAQDSPVYKYPAGQKGWWLIPEDGVRSQYIWWSRKLSAHPPM